MFRLQYRPLNISHLKLEVAAQLLIALSLLFFPQYLLFLADHLLICYIYCLLYFSQSNVNSMKAGIFILFRYISRT